MRVNRLIEGAAFEPEATALMGRAYEAAIRQLGADLPATVIETVAKRIVEAARAGERNPDKLTDFALRGLGSRGRTP
jgi:hypothetical protein